MIDLLDTTRTALAEVQQELRQLGDRLAECNGQTPPMLLADLASDLGKLRKKASKLSAGLTPPPPKKDGGPTLPGLGGPDPDPGNGTGRRRR